MRSLKEGSGAWVWEPPQPDPQEHTPALPPCNLPFDQGFLSGNTPLTPEDCNPALYNGGGSGRADDPTSFASVTGIDDAAEEDDLDPALVPTFTANCPFCGHPPPCRVSFGWNACEHQWSALGLVPL